MGKLSNKNIIVTDTARGLDRKYALRLASLDANAGVIDINLKSFEEYTAEEELFTADIMVGGIKALGVDSVGAVADIGNREQVFAAVEVIARELGDISVLANNAGDGMGPMDGNKASQLSQEQFRATVERNFFGTAYTCNVITSVMKELGYGKIVNVISVDGLMTNSDGSYSHYASSKAAIIHYTKLLAQELGPYNATRNVVTPGFISAARLVAEYRAAGEEKFIRNIALGRFGVPEERANTIEFLVMNLFSHVDGAALGVTGGTVGRILINQ